MDYKWGLICLWLSLLFAKWPPTVTGQKPGQILANKERQNVMSLNKNLQDLFNSQISKEYGAFYAYDQMASLFALPSVGYPGFAKLFKDSADEEIGHARKLVDFMNTRLHVVSFKSILSSSDEMYQKITGPMQAIAKAITLENEVTLSLKALSKACSDADDTQASDVIDEFLSEQVKGIAKLITLETRMQNDPTRIFLIDQELQK